MVHEDYLFCSEYVGKPAHATESGFVAFQDEESKLHFFALTDEEGVLLKSEGYPQETGRDNGIQSVIKNRVNSEFYSVKQYENGSWYLSLRAGNHKEIARSCHFESEAAALASISHMTGETKRVKVMAVAAPTTSTDGDGASGRYEDDYLSCKEYSGHGEVDPNGFTRWQHANGEYYFTWHNADGSTKMRSEGYPTTAARDNGMDSVMRNRDNDARYSIEEKMGYFFLVLKAGNHQEIARSCGTKDRASLVASSAETVAVAETHTVEAEAAAAVAPIVVIEIEKEDDYMVCSEYKGHGGADDNGITKFKGSDGQHYFTIYDNDGKVQLRSEGFRTEADLQVEYDLVVK